MLAMPANVRSQSNEVWEMIEVAAENEQLLRTGYGAFASGDLATVERMFHPGVIWHAQRLGQLGGDHVGWPAVADFFRRSMELTRGTFRADLLEVMSNDNGAAAVVRSSGERDGLRLDDKQVHLFYLENNRVVEVWQFVGDGEAA